MRKHIVFLMNKTKSVSTTWLYVYVCVAIIISHKIHTYKVT